MEKLVNDPDYSVVEIVFQGKNFQIPYYENGNYFPNKKTKYVE